MAGLTNQHLVTYSDPCTPLVQARSANLLSTFCPFSNLISLLRGANVLKGNIREFKKCQIAEKKSWSSHLKKIQTLVIAFFIFGIWWDQFLKAWLIFGSISIFGLQLHHIMASNGNKYKSTAQWEHYVMWIQLGRETIKIQPKFGLWKIFIAGFLWIFCIYLNKERSYNKIKIDLRSRNDALSSDKNFLFRKLVTC